MRRPTVVPALALSLALGLAACTAGTDGAAPAGASPGADGSQQTGRIGGGTGAAAPGDATGGPELLTTMRDGVWPVADVGEIDFIVTDRGLELVEMRPAAGWEVTDQEAGPEEIEVDLRGTGADTSDVRTTVEVGIQSGILEIEIDQLLDPPGPGPLVLGDAGTAELFVDGPDVGIGEVVLSDGWRETQRAGPGRDAELGLRRSGPGVVESWELDARMDDGGLEVHTDYEIQGPVGP